MSSPFGNISSLGGPAKAKSGSKFKPTTDIAGWEEYAALVKASKALEALVEARREALLKTIEPELTKLGLAGHKPSMNPVEGDAVGSAALAKKSTRSPLSEGDLAALAEIVHNVDDFVEVVEETPELYAVNPRYATDDKLIGRIIKAIEPIVGKLEEGFFVKQDRVAKTVVSNNAMANLFKLDENAVEVLRGILTNPRLVATYSKSLAEAWNLIRPLIPEAEEAAANAPKKGARESNPKGKLDAMLKAAEKATRRK
jgi:hypothetical protein